MARRIVIIGGPHVGKTTLSEKLINEYQISVLHTSHDLERLFPSNQGRGENWGKSSEYASRWFDEDGDWICEGVQMARALRKWLRNNPNKPLDADIVWLTKPQTSVVPGQVTMAKGVMKVLNEIRGELVKRGARIHHLRDPDEAINLFSTNPERDAPETREGVIPQMAYKRNLTKAEWEQLPETTRTFFTEQKVYVADGENWKLDADDSEDVTKLTAAIKKEREARAQFEKDLKAEKDKYQGFDLEKYNQLMADAEAKETDELRSKGKIDELIEKGKQREKVINDQWQAKYDAVVADNHKLQIDYRLHKAFEDGGVIPDRIEDAVELTKKVVKLTDKGELQVLDTDGSPLDASLDIYAKELLKEKKPWLYAATNAAGTGAQNGNNGSDRMPDLSKLSATEKLKYANRAEAAK